MTVTYIIRITYPNNFQDIPTFSTLLLNQYIADEDLMNLISTESVESTNLSILCYLDVCSLTKSLLQLRICH